MNSVTNPEMYERASMTKVLEQQSVLQTLFVAYELQQTTASNEMTIVHRVKKVFLTGRIVDWEVVSFQNNRGQSVKGLRLEYEQDIDQPGNGSGRIGVFRQTIKLPKAAYNVQFFQRGLPEDYKEAIICS